MTATNGRLIVWTATAVLFCCGVVAGMQAPTAPTAGDPYRQLAAQRTMDLGQCNAALGPLQQLSAQVMTGAVQSVDQFRQRFEAANPGKTLTEKFEVHDKKES